MLQQDPATVALALHDDAAFPFHPHFHRHSVPHVPVHLDGTLIPSSPLSSEPSSKTKSGFGAPGM